MLRRALLVLLAGGMTALLLPSNEATAAKAPKRHRPITKLTVDPNAEVVELFDAMDLEQVEVKVMPKSALEATAFFENKTDKPLTIQLPEGVVAAPIHAQFGGGFGGGGMGGGGMGGMGGMGGGGMGGMGGGGMQSMGGGMGGMGGMQGGMGGGQGGGFFSIPPMRTVAVPMTTVCLEHGKDEPMPGAKYKLVRMEDATTDPQLQALIILVGTGRINPAVAQAAAWHLANGLSWNDLANKRAEQLGGRPPVQYFSRAQLFAAQALVAEAKGLSERRAEELAKNPKPEPRARRVDAPAEPEKAPVATVETK